VSSCGRVLCNSTSIQPNPVVLLLVLAYRCSTPPPTHPPHPYVGAPLVLLPLVNLPPPPLSPTGKKALAMEAFARALRMLPTTICDNAGLDSADIVATLRASHGSDPEGTTAGVDIVTGAAGDMKQRGIYESFRVKQQVGGGVCVCGGGGGGGGGEGRGAWGGVCVGGGVWRGMWGMESACSLGQLWSTSNLPSIVGYPIRCPHDSY
jgi:hypothetical protein